MLLSEGVLSRQLPAQLLGEVMLMLQLPVQLPGEVMTRQLPAQPLGVLHSVLVPRL